MALQQLTPRQFLTRVASRIKMSALCDHQYVVTHEDDEEIHFKALVDDDNNEGAASGGAVVSPDITQSTTNCRICFELPCTVLFSKCRHMNACTPCYKMCYAVQKEEYRQLIAEWYTDDMDIPPFVIKCPFCREEHEKQDIFIDIFV